ncbi:MAG: dihydrolipoyl dehydrogenase [Planctomycetes bacterium]|nr:dihydrolipoyl dehydrogenase [Planctomycetota bacterium]MCH8966681.1 dihydrolipoyl dehydrogenase [Planctomycetota bacterium]
MGEFTQETDLLVIGGGPGGYHAAFRAASHGIQTTIIEAMPDLGGVCLHRGCIPSKTYLSLVETIHAATSSRAMGIEFGKPKFDVDKIRAFKQEVVTKLAGGLDALCKKHKVEKLQGTARFEDHRHVTLTGAEVARVRFRRAIIATGSVPTTLGDVQIDSPRVLTSKTALELADIPKSVLVIGGGYIGLELGQVYAGFGSRVTVVEMLPGLLVGPDPDLVRPLIKRLKIDFEEICLETSVVSMKEVKRGIELGFEGKNPPKTNTFDKVLVAVGRRPNAAGLELGKAGIDVDDRGFIKVDSGFHTSASRIYAIGDVIGNPMLAHKALHEGRVVADNLAGKDTVFEPRAIPAVVFTDPQIAWAGVTQTQAKEQGLSVVVKKLPWTASGRAVALGRTDGLTKMIFDEQTGLLLGVGLTGPHAAEMIAEGVLAIEMGATAYDIACTIHPHPTLSETLFEVASMMPS